LDGESRNRRVERLGRRSYIGRNKVLNK
jgi:hypothetical protein